MNTKNSTNPTHPLHDVIGKHLEKELFDFSNIEVKRDPACGGNQLIPLFLEEDNTRENKLCQVDLMILKDDEIKVIIEIEESNIKPVQILGKLFASTLAKNYIHHSNNYQAIKMADDVCFIQVLDTKILKEGSKKEAQWKKIEEKIQGILKKLNFPVKTYKVFYGKLEESTVLLKEITDCITDKLK
ncbi:MAG TPA: hypothetical protein PLB61_08905 [Bacteroidales bacterium]|nr:hypothetical protein [Bacteroidales bacterium]